MDRILGSMEHAFWLTDQIAPVHFALTARVVGEFRVDQLEQALIEVQQQHPLLRVRVALDESGQSWFVEDAASIPLRVVERQGEQHWQREVEQELSQPLNWAKAPLLRVVLLRSADRSEGVCEIVLVCSHTIGDGLSAAYLLQDILQAFNHPPVGQPSSLSDHPPLDDSIPPGASVPQTAETDANKVEDTYRYPLLSVEAVSSQLYSPQLLFWSLSSAETASLLSRCRQAQTTIYAAICAAFFLAIASEGETQSQRNEPLICLSPINIRKYLLPPVQEEYGFYMFVKATSHPLISDLGLWELARSLKDQLNQQMSPNHLFEEIPNLQAFISTCPVVVRCGQFIQRSFLTISW